jgi:hypothetical protein
MLKNHQAIKQPKGECRNDQEVHRCDPIGVIAKECLPRPCHVGGGLAELCTSGPIDLAIMPIGAYNPWIHSHCTPEQAVQMANEAGAHFIMPVHHQFRLSSEDFGEPIERFQAALHKTPERIALREIGETFVLPEMPIFRPPPCPLTRRMQSSLARADVAQRVKQRSRTMPALRGLILLRRVHTAEVTERQAYLQRRRP